MLVSLLLKSLIRVGKLTVIDATGKPHPFKGSDGPAVTVRLHDRSLQTPARLPGCFVGAGSAGPSFSGYAQK